MTERVIDIGGVIEPEADYDGPVLVVFAIDPGVATGWSAWKVPVGLLAEGTVARTLARCRHRYGTILRSQKPSPLGAGATFNSTDGAHVSAILRQARIIYDEWMPQWSDCHECEGSGTLDVGENALVCEVCEGAGGEWDVDNPDEWQFVFAMENFVLRMLDQDPALLSPVRVGAVLMDRLEQAESETPVFFQSASDAMNTVTDQRLKSWGIYDSHSGAHARDASRHGVLFIRRFASSLGIREGLYGYDPLSISQSLS